MFATVHTTPPSGAAPAGAIEVAHLDGSGSTTIAFWLDETAAPPGRRAYRLVDRVDGPAAGRTPLFAQVAWVNGDGNPAVAAAAEYGGRERLNPSIRDIEGVVGVLVFRSAEHRIVVIGMATSLETHAAVMDRINNTPLLPGEDPALLPGPDRLALGRVVRADIPQAVRS
jgi:hypothetical protein